ncbi:isocitrate lyase/PEP mutase family protein [Actinosynnema sp.]|uniref:isocitrate lyase/PEP mutase family protein n=1 Tax=Actinosynnema sp. TaxID=1872144 RepID=UPI003F878AB0
MDLDLPVPPVPPATSGVAWLRATVARFSEGEAHTRRRALAERLLAAIPPESLRRPGDHVATLAEALGAPRAIARDVRLTASAYHPHLPPSPAADAAVARLVAAFGNRWDEPTAARIGLLVQATTATDALIAGATPAVPATRRVRDGQVVEVPLAEHPFGAGRHACPGRAHALAAAEGARAFHRLHHADTPLLLPNAWDSASATALAEAGFAAVGTTSLGVAAAAGLPAAEGRAKAETLALAARITHLPVPVTVDVEAGFGADPADLAAELHALGVAGVNVEDGRGDHLADPAEQADLIRRAKAAAPALFVNARVDCHWLGIDRASALDRALRYADAGADGVFLPGLADPAGIERAVAALPVPLNLLAQLDFRTLADLGVKRVSTGSLLFRAALGAAVATAEAFRDGLPTPEVPSYERVQALAQRG